MVKLDLCGLNCPIPVLKTKKFLMTVDNGTVVTIYTTDPASKDDLKDFCDKTGNILISQNHENNTITTIIKKKPYSNNQL